MLQQKNVFRSLLKRWIDLLGISIFIVCLITVVFFFLRRAEYVVVTLRISKNDNLSIWSAPQPQWYLDHITPGLADKDVFGKTNLEVIKVHSYPNNGTEQTVFVDIKVRAVYNRTSKTYSYNGTPLLISTYQNFNVGSLQISGVIHDLDYAISKSKKSIKVEGELEVKYNEDSIHLSNTEFQGIRKYISQRIVPGLSVKDSDGNEIAKVLDVKRTPSYKRFIYNGSLVNVFDTERERIYLIVQLETTQSGQHLLYREETPILINSIITLDFPEFSTNLTVRDPNYTGNDAFSSL